LKEDGGDASPEALLEGAGADLERGEARESVVGAQPESDNHKREGGDEEEGIFGARLKKEEAREGEERADEIGKLEGGPYQDKVRQGEQGPGFAVLAAKHGCRTG